MLIKYSGPDKFVFVANTKCASTTCEASKLGRTADIRLTTTWVGKHMTLAEIRERFDCVFAEIPFEQFFKFGIIRDPVDWVVSWFNFRARPVLADPTHRSHSNYTGNMEFSDFWNRNKHSGFLRPQSAMFSSPDRPEVRLDYLVRFEAMREGLAVVEEILGGQSLRTRTRKNRSLVRRVAPDEIEDRVKTDIMNAYRSDYELIENLESYNAIGLERFEERTRSNGARAHRLIRGAKDLINDTPLEAPARWMTTRIRMRTLRRQG